MGKTKRLVTPVPIKGKLGIWSWQPKEYPSLIPNQLLDTKSEGRKNVCSLNDETCPTPYQCANCQVKKTYELGFETLREPVEDGMYLCRCQFYKDKDDVVEENISWYGEWNVTNTWNVLGWKKLAKNDNKFK